MATYYVDPTALTNGSGSFASPFNVWTSAWTACGAASSDVLLQKEGTTFTGTVGFTKNGASADAPIIVGVYDAVSGNRILNTMAAAKVNGGGTSIGMNMQDRYNVLVDGFEVYNCANYGFYEGHSAGTLDQKHEYVTGMQFKNCFVHDIQSTSLAAMWIQGSGVKYNNILIQDCAGDGIYHGGQCVAEDVTIKRIDNTNGGLGDCVSQFYLKGFSVWRRCILDHTNNSNKQAMVIGLNGATQTNYTGILIEDCKFYGNVTGSGLVTFSDLTAFTLRRCKFLGDKGPYVLGSGSSGTFDSNLIIGTDGDTIGIGCASGATVVATHNTIIKHKRGVELLGSNGTSKNNISYCVGAVTPIAANTKTTNFTTDPALDGQFRPTEATCLTGGTFSGGADYYGSEFSSVCPIGAAIPRSSRSVASKRAIRLKAGITG